MAYRTILSDKMMFFSSFSCDRQMLRWLQWRRVKPHVEVTVTLGGAYFVYFFANAYLASSGKDLKDLRKEDLSRV